MDISPRGPIIGPLAWARENDTRAAFGRAHLVLQSSVADYINAAVTPYISGDLISPDVLANIQGIASLLPGALTDSFGFECPLGIREPRADFLVCSEASQGGREILAGHRPGTELTDLFQEHPVWRRIRSFSTEWSNPQSALFTNVHNMWSEFDVDGMPLSTPVPSVFIGATNLRPLQPAPDTSEMPSHCAWLTDSALPILLGSSLDSSLRRQIARCLNFLPSSAYIFQVGLMLGRTSPITRLCIGGLSGTQIIEYLRVLDYYTPLTEVEDLVNSLDPLVERIKLDLDVADRVLPKIGLECRVDADRVAIRRFFNYLVSSNLSTPAKAEALQSWGGMAHERLTPDIWPRDLLALSCFLRERVHSAFARLLHHIKIVYQPDLPLQAKAYFGVSHLWLAPAALKDMLQQAAAGTLEQKR